MDTTIYGIAYKCPHGERKKDCPFYVIGNLLLFDHLSFKDKINWIEGFNKNKKNSIVEFHVHCSKRRENKISS